jgi:hypothetical protein
LAIREKTAGRAIVLATAADAVLAEQLASGLSFIDRVFASDGERNLKGSAKDGVIGQPSLWIAEDFGCCASG